MTAFSGTLRLTRLALRREARQLVVWLTVLTVLLAASTAVTLNEYASDSDRLTAARLIASSPALLLLRGAAADASTASLIMADIAPIVSALLAVYVVLAVVRNTRQNEDTGRADLVESTAVGRWAMLSGALLAAVGASLVQGGLFAAVLVGAGLGASGAIAAGAAMAGVGIAFAAIAGLTAQLAASGRTASGLALGVLGAAYLLRGLGDVLGAPTPDGTSVTAAWPGWLSPFGWAQQLDPFGEPRWWLLALPVALFGLVSATAFAVRARRDLGFGIIPPGRGPEAAGPALRSPLGLAWRLQRGLLLGWAIGLGIAAAVFGSLGQQVQVMAANEQFQEILQGLAGGTGELENLLFVLAMTLVGLGAAAYVAQAVLVLRAEEAEGRLEAVLATGVSRSRWLASNVACIVFGLVALLLLSGLAAAAAYGAATGEFTARLGDLLIAALAQAPAALVVAGVGLAAFGFLPRLASAVTWAALLSALLFGLFGDMLDLPQALRNLSPFSHVPAVPAVPLDVTPLLGLLAVAGLLTAAGAAAFSRRNLALPA